MELTDVQPKVIGDWAES